MAKVGNVNFQDENEKKSILEKYFTRQTLWGYERTKPDEITESPIVQELYFRDRFKEIKNLEKLIEELLEQELASRENKAEQPLIVQQNCMESIQGIAESRIARNVIKTSQEVKTGYIEMENPNQNRENAKD